MTINPIMNWIDATKIRVPAKGQSIQITSPRFTNSALRTLKFWQIAKQKKRGEFAGDISTTQ